MPDSAPERSSVSPEELAALRKTFEDFQFRAEKLDQAYRAMQEDFKKVNLELDKKNRELAESLRKQEETQTYLNSILESMNNGVVGVDILGTITLFNRAASEITGYNAEEVVGRKYEDFFHDENKPDVSLLRVLHTGEELRHDEKVMWYRDGHPVPVSFQTAMLRDQDETTLGAVEVFTDISRIKALEEEMQRTKTMAALGEMSATVAHEIRNPLGAMGVWVGLLDREIPRDDPRKRTLGKITTGLSRLNRIVSNLLVYTRPVKPELRKVKLQDILNEIVDFVGIEIERDDRSVEVKKVWKENEPVYIMADPEKIQQVVMNLCLNAVQAMPEGGTLSVCIDASTREHAGLAKFRIADTGIGIEKERIERIFDPFHTSKENGTGLGLAIVRKFVESHSGYIDVKSTVGTGTTVNVFLPMVAP